MGRVASQNGISCENLILFWTIFNSKEGLNHSYVFSIGKAVAMRRLHMEELERCCF